MKTFQKEKNYQSIKPSLLSAYANELHTFLLILLPYQGLSLSIYDTKSTDLITEKCLLVRPE